MDITSIELLTQQRLAETGLSAAELLALPMDEWARITGRPTATQAALAALDAQAEFVPPGTPRQPAPQLPEQTAGTPEPPDFKAMPMAEYAAYRQAAGMGQGRKEGVGIFGSVSSRSPEYIAATRAQAGRTAWTTSNVEESPRIPRPMVRPDVPLDSRSGTERLSTPGNSWQG